MVASNVGCFVGRHVFQNVCRAFFIHVADNLSLTFGGHFFKRFGGRFIVERFHNIGAVLVGESLSQARDFDRMQARQFSS